MVGLGATSADSLTDEGRIEFRPRVCDNLKGSHTLIVTSVKKREKVALRTWSPGLAASVSFGNSAPRRSLEAQQSVALTGAPSCWAKLQSLRTMALGCCF